ncbi:DUF1036 domain-containing protein [Nocardia rhizosphaerihabitans]|uniref:DUF1036 domain-containing protein n=1 Tax=Nocardia rhizosphaerihabitans TaxID=1691570 RepID=A0ABQ2KH80_9NOCA|nr:DUF1036 domain-containing protein [Nocardia rhizosphaerihabitans]GGN83399.1 hypothetical protein GCM10011610_35670 [Nocardia rhizosphaerihabitans]
MPWLAFHNDYGLVVSVAVMQVDPGACGGYGGWATHGWWNLNPGETKTAIWTKYDAAYYYAKASNGAWWGDSTGPRVYVNPYAAFHSCVLIGTSTWDVVNMKRVGVGSNLHNTHTVNLIP